MTDKWNDYRFLFNNVADDYRGNWLASVVDKGVKDVSVFVDAANFQPAGSSGVVSKEIINFIAGAGGFFNGMRGKNLSGYPLLKAQLDKKDSDAAKFYNKYITIDGSDNIQHIPSSITGRSELAHNMPDFPKGFALEDGTKPDVDYFRSLFAESTASHDDTKKIFNRDIDGMFRKSIFKFSSSKVQDVDTSTFPEKTFAVLDMQSKNVIGRKANGTFYRMEGDKEIPLGVDDVETKRILQANHKCYGTGIKLSDDECRTFIREALINGDKTKLEEAIKRFNGQSYADVFHEMKSDITSLHPLLAHRILQQFGFRVHQRYCNNAGMSLLKVETVSHWLKHGLAKRFSDAAVQEMIRSKGQEHVLQYLDLLVQFVNSNPAILNKGYSKTSAEARDRLELPEYSKQLRLDWEVVKPQSIKSDLIRLKPHLQLFGYGYNPRHLSTRSSVFTPYGGIFTPGLSMVGGGDGCDSPCVIEKKGCTKHLENILNSELGKIKARGHRLDANVEAKIKENIKKAGEYEDRMMSTLCMLEVVNLYLDMFPTYRSDILNEETLHKIVKRYEDLVLGSQHHSEKIRLLLEKLSDFSDSNYRNITSADFSN